MPRTSVNPTRITLAGVTIDPAGAGTAVDVANGNVVPGNTGSTLFVAVANTHATTPYACTFVTTATVGNSARAVADEVKNLAALEKKVYGPFPLAEFGRALQIDAENAAVKFQPFYI